MVETYSNEIIKGTKAFNFTLKDEITSKYIELEKIKGDIATVIIFMCNHCPYVLHIIEQFVDVISQYKTKGIECIAINSNDVNNYPEDSPEKMKLFGQKYNFSFPYIFDETQNIAKKYKAACTPDLFVFDKKLQLSYQGQFDDSTPGNNIPVTGKDLINALDCLIENKENLNPQLKSMGCNIKWK